MKKISNSIMRIKSIVPFSRQGLSNKECTICGTSFKPKTRHTLYCGECRESEELLFSDWLPDFPVGMNFDEFDSLDDHDKAA